MSEFTTPLILIPQDEKWVLFDSFEYHIGSYPSEEIIIVPNKFVTDLASVPRILWPILPPFGKYGKAAVLHDFLYASGYKTRKHCDQVFLEAMEVLNVPKWKRIPMYLAVRLFGFRAYRKR